MYTNYNIPQKNCCKPGNFKNSQNYMTTTYPTTNYSTNYNYNPSSYNPVNYSTTSYNDGDRFIGGGLLAPFLLGGVGGYLLGRPNYGPGPIPVYFPPGPPPGPIPPYPVPYSNTNIYY